jgi:hypothetical protein
MLKVIEQKKSCLPVWIFCLLFMFSGCADLQKSMDDFGIEETPPLPDPVNLAYPFTDLPIPQGFDRDHAKSFVYESGSGTIKVGRLFFSGWGNMEKIMSFYQSEMVNQGWKLINAMEHDGTILNYKKEGWISTVVIRSKLGTTKIKIVIGPQ